MLFNEVPMQIKTTASFILVILLSLSLIACSTSQIITDIQIAVDLVAVGTPIVKAFGGPAAAYMKTAADGLNCVLTAAEAPNATTGQISAAFGTCFATVVAPTVGLPPQISAIIVAVSAAINFLVSRYGPKSTLLATTGDHKVKLTYGDHHSIKAMRAKLAGK